MKNKLSIITVVKNDKDNILTTLRSVKLQSYLKYEHIVFDGNSHDGTSEIIKNNLDKKIKYFRQKDKNLYDAINKAILKTSGKYILLLHSGDFFYNKKTLEKINSYLKNDIDFIYGNLIYYKNLSIKRIWKYKKVNLNFFNSYKIAHPTLVLKRKIAKNIKYNINFKISSDTDFLIRLLKQRNIKKKHLSNYILFMSSGGLSTSLKYLYCKVLEDIKIYYNHFNLYGIWIYLGKILSKVNSLFFDKKMEYRQNLHLIKQLKNLKNNKTIDKKKI
jgi:glycosyltransferase